MTSLLGDPPADLSGVMAVRAVIHDFVEVFGDGGDSAVRLALDDQLDAEVLRLATSTEERAVVVMAPRTGSWLGEPAADGRALPQRDTDMLVRSEVWSSGLVRDLESITDSIGPPVLLEMTVGDYVRRAHVQRGGISSDPLVRLLAFRAWGRRDIDWGTGTYTIEWMRLAVECREVSQYNQRPTPRTDLCPLPVGHRGRCRRDPTEPHGGAIACGRPLERSMPQAIAVNHLGHPVRRDG